MSYRIALRPAAGRQLDRMRGRAYIALRGVILALGKNPRPTGSGRLAGRTDLWRLRVRIDGQPWRVIYKIDDGGQLVRVVRVARRDERTYRGI